MDRFLFAHKWKTLPVFDLAARAPAISIRDQIVRGAMLAERLPDWLEERTYRKPNRVFIVGAGAAGVSTAFGLLEKEVPVRLADREDFPFTLQLGSDRLLDPTQYD